MTSLREEFKDFCAKRLAGELILLDAFTREAFEKIHGDGSFGRLGKSQLITASNGHRYATRQAVEDGPLKHS